MTHASEIELREAFEAFNLGGVDGGRRLRVLRDRHASDARMHFLLGALLEREGRYGDALVSLDAALALAPDNVQALSAKASVLQALYRGPEAQSMLSAAVLGQPTSGQLWANLGVVLEAAGKFAEALPAYDRSIALPDSPLSARLNRGYVLTRLGRLQDALENNEALAALQPDYADAHFNVAEVLLALHRYEQAREACNRALAMDPSHAKAHIDRALALAAMGKVDEAQQDLDRAKALSPQAVVDFNLGFAGRSGGILGDFGAYSIYFHLSYEKLMRCDWSEREALVNSIGNLIKSTAGTSRAPTDPNLPFRVLSFEIEPASQRRNSNRGPVAEACSAYPGPHGKFGCSHSRGLCFSGFPRASLRFSQQALVPGSQPVAFRSIRIRARSRRRQLDSGRTAVGI
jgi:tetratricopeptide (TPR) repeat protein